jgi:hypothetical protein
MFNLFMSFILSILVSNFKPINLLLCALVTKFWLACFPWCLFW